MDYEVKETKNTKNNKEKNQKSTKYENENAVSESSSSMQQQQQQQNNNRRERSNSVSDNRQKMKSSNVPTSTAAQEKNVKSYDANNNKPTKKEKSYKADSANNSITGIGTEKETMVTKKPKKPRKKRKVQQQEQASSSSSPRIIITGGNKDNIDDSMMPSSEHMLPTQTTHRRNNSNRSGEKAVKKVKKKKEKLAKEKSSKSESISQASNTEKDENTTERITNRPSSSSSPPPKKMKRLKGDSTSGSNNNAQSYNNHPHYTPAQNAVNDMMRRALEEDQYSALGSIVDTYTSDSEEDDSNVIMTLGQANKVTAVKLDRSLLQSALRRKLRGGGNGSMANTAFSDMDKLGGSTNTPSKKRKKGKKGHHKSNNQDLNNNAMVVTNTPIIPSSSVCVPATSSTNNNGNNEMDNSDNEMENEFMADEGYNNNSNNNNGNNNNPFYGQDAEVADDSSIFDQPTGATNSTWVECDKCKKWRRLRGVVDTKKLPSKWYCAMNKNDPERARCTAPEEDYDVPSTPESATDHRARKHLRLWVRRLQCNEAYEARQPNIVTTRSSLTSTSAIPSKKIQARSIISNNNNNNNLNNSASLSSGSNSKERKNRPYEWIRCSNPSCGKWRALLRFMDVQSILERTPGGEWYCVMNTWDEKTASCAAPQEALPAIGCPSWVRVDDEIDE